MSEQRKAMVPMDPDMVMGKIDKRFLVGMELPLIKVSDTKLKDLKIPQIV